MMRRWRILTMMALALGLVPPAPRAWAQGSTPSEAEVSAILGAPVGASAALDPNVMGILGKPEGATPDAALSGARSADIASKLRCPVCQGVSIADSPSGLASQMRGQVRDLVARGYSEEQVLRYFENSYGEFVRLEPPLRGLNWMLWLLPAVALLSGGLFVFSRARQGAPATAPILSAPAENAADPAIAKYLDQIRRDSGLSS